MMVFYILRDIAFKHKSYRQLLGLCIILGVSSILYDFKSIHSYNDGGVAGELRRVLLHDADSPVVRTPLESPPAIRASAYYKSRAKKKLDFFVAGFPKCGTTTLLYSFAEHNETDITTTEKCVILNAQISDVVALNRLDDAISELNPAPGIKRAIKCPTGIRNARSIERIQNHSPNARFIIGIRHPVTFLQSYYNYRITEIYDKNSTETIPTLESMVGQKEWKGVSSDLARFDLYLKQLGKTNMSMPELQDFVGRPHMAVRPNTFKVFLYSLDQMKDKDEKRSRAFREEVRNFLQLDSPLPPFGHENINNFVGEYAHPETVDICDSRYDGVRDVLVGHGRTMERWVRKEFIKSADVTVANEKHFLETIRSYGSDPCKKSSVKKTSRRLQK